MRIPVLQLFFNVISFLLSEPNRHGACIKDATQLNTQVRSISLEVLIDTEGSFACGCFVNTVETQHWRPLIGILSGVSRRRSYHQRTCCSQCEYLLFIMYTIVQFFYLCLNVDLIVSRRFTIFYLINYPFVFGNQLAVAGETLDKVGSSTS